ncbi:hypothetical protein A946_03440 [Methylacidiphilum kamchatkense Kam1]|uniref:Uncharacterized protein n=1 Tax=Methylacidiphilum kamchatkense Kam1 TaxID=1202785 RepID=A0ABR4ZZA4_9BACT|nr:hypothetical protein A946_03440 [Methylacidiphilum kamchatkense Kam1]
MGCGKTLTYPLIGEEKKLLEVLYSGCFVVRRKVGGKKERLGMERNKAFVIGLTFRYCQKGLELLNQNLLPKKGKEERGMVAFF